MEWAINFQRISFNSSLHTYKDETEDNDKSVAAEVSSRVQLTDNLLAHATLDYEEWQRGVEVDWAFVSNSSHFLIDKPVKIQSTIPLRLRHRSSQHNIIAPVESVGLCTVSVTLTCPTLCFSVLNGEAPRAWMPRSIFAPSSLHLEPHHSQWHLPTIFYGQNRQLVAK